MFDKFGEFNSAEELNKAAEGLKEEGDTKSLLELAKENGIDKEDAQDYIDGCVDELCNERMAAFGKLKIESQELQMKGIMEDWLSYIKNQIAENEAVAAAVRKKGKSLEGCIAALLNWSFKNQIPVPQKVMKAAGISSSKCTMGIPGMGQAKKIIKEYYLGKQV